MTQSDVILLRVCALVTGPGFPYDVVAIDDVETLNWSQLSLVTIA